MISASTRSAPPHPPTLPASIKKETMYCQKLMLLIFGLIITQNLNSQTQLLEKLCDKSNYIFVGEVEDFRILWQDTEDDIGIVVKVEKFIKTQKGVDTTNVSRVMFVVIQFHFWHKGGWTPIRVKKGEKYIFFASEIGDYSKSIHISADYEEYESFSREVLVNDCILTDFWIHGIKYSEALEKKVEGFDHNEIDNSRKKNNNHYKFMSRDSMVVYSDTYIDLGKVTQINKVNDDLYPYHIKVKINGSPQNSDEHVLRSDDEVKIYLKDLDCICFDKLMEGHTYAFFLKKEGDKYVLNDKYLGIIENIIWDWRNP